MNRRSFLAVVSGMLLVPKDALAVPAGLLVGGENEWKSRMAMLSNHQLRRMVIRFRLRHGEFDHAAMYRNLRWLIKQHPEQYQYLRSRGWVESNSESQLELMWRADCAWLQEMRTAATV